MINIINIMDPFKYEHWVFNDHCSYTLYFIQQVNGPCFGLVGLYLGP